VTIAAELLDFNQAKSLGGRAAFTFINGKLYLEALAYRTISVGDGNVSALLLRGVGVCPRHRAGLTKIKEGCDTLSIVTCAGS
jgi:hypothetical protein